MTKVLSCYRYVVAVFLAVAVVAAHPSSTKWVGLSLGIGAFLVDWAVRATVRRTLRFDIVDLAWAAICGFMALSYLWTPNHGEALLSAITAAGCLFLLAYLKEYATPRLMTVLAASIAVSDGIVLLLYSHYPLDYWGGYGNRGFITEALTMTLPFLWVLWKNPSRLLKLLAIVTGVTITGFLEFYSTSAIHLFVVAMIGAVLTIWLAFRRFGPRAGWACLLAWIIVPAIVGDLAWDRLDLTRRLLIRLEVWGDTLFMFADAPLFGHGAGSFVSLHPIYREAHNALFSYQNHVFASYNTEAEASHNELLQMLAEFGLTGLILVAGLLTLAYRGFRRRVGLDPFVTAGAVALLVILAESMLEYPLQKPTTLTLTVMALGFALHGRPPELKAWTLRLNRPATALACVALLSVAAGLGFTGYRQQVANAIYGNARMQTADSVLSLRMLWNAYQENPLNHDIRTTLPIALNQVLMEHGIKSVPPATVDKLFAIARDGGRYNTGVLVAQTQYLINTERLNDPLLAEVVADLHKGTDHVAIVALMDARLALLHGNRAAALAAVAKGRQLAEDDVDNPTMPQVRQGLDDIEQAALQLPVPVSPLFLKQQP